MANRFAILENPQAEGMPYLINRQATDANETKKKQNHPTNINKRKVIILGDRHARGFAAEISRELGTNFEVMGTVMPGARLEQITKLAEKEVTKKDTVIVVGGTNDINRNEAKIGLKHLEKFVRARQNINIMIMNAPFRHDLIEASCVNKEVETYNIQLSKIMKTTNNVKILPTTLQRDDFTHHGLHFNTSGKEKMTALLAENIRDQMVQKEEARIILEWRKIQPDTTQEGIKDEVENQVVKNSIHLTVYKENDNKMGQQEVRTSGRS
jgi:lysophospholipase L1-like esterase